MLCSDEIWKLYVTSENSVLTINCPQEIQYQFNQLNQGVVHVNENIDQFIIDLAREHIGFDLIVVYGFNQFQLLNNIQTILNKKGFLLLLISHHDFENLLVEKKIDFKDLCIELLKFSDSIVVISLTKDMGFQWRIDKELFIKCGNKQFIGRSENLKDKIRYYQKKASDLEQKIALKNDLILSRLKSEEEILMKYKDLMFEYNRLEAKYYNISKKYELLSNSKLGKLTLFYWKLRNRIPKDF